MDTWLIDGWLKIDHAIGCECGCDEFGNRSTPSRSVRRHVQAPDAEQAEAAAVRAWRERHADQVDSQCDVYFECPPTAFNVSQHEREKAALKAWNEDKPIIVEGDPPCLFTT